MSAKFVDNILMSLVGLGTFAKLGEADEWLRGRNTLLSDFGKGGKTHVLVCEGGVCRDEYASDDAAKITRKPMDQNETTITDILGKTTLSEGPKMESKSLEAQLLFPSPPQHGP